MKFDRNSFNAFREDVEKALEDVAKKYEVEITSGNISYSGVEFTLQLKCISNEGGTNGKKLLFEQQCSIYGFKKEDYEREFILDKKRFKLVGFNPSSPKNNCQIVCLANGATYKCNDSVVKLAFSTQV